MMENSKSEKETRNKIYHRRRHRHSSLWFLSLTSVIVTCAFCVNHADSLPATAASLQSEQANSNNPQRNSNKITNASKSSVYYRHKEVFGPDANYILEWTVDLEKTTVLFNVSAVCKGYVALGLSKNGSISVGSDFVVGGVDSSGKPYFSDMHGTVQGTLAKDYRQDWSFIDVHGSADGRTYLTFSRPFETCDEQDYQISEDLVHIIWAYGDTDEVTLSHPHNFGSHPLYLLDPDASPNVAMSVYQQIGPHSSLALMQRWRAMIRQRVPSRTTSQICSIIRGPRLNLQHFIVGGGAYLPFSESRKHVRKIILSRCRPPNPDDDPVNHFDPFIKNRKEGEECDARSVSSFPKQLCSETIFVWGTGGKAFYFPEEIGTPIGLSRNEYYLLEVHYHNPGHLEDLTVKAGLDLMFHPRPRQAGDILLINYASSGFFTIPPFSASFSIFSHCSSDCIKNSVIPAGTESFKIFAVMVEMNALGRSVRLRHFRKGVELEWILKDDNYDSNFQQIRQTQSEVEILPGDQLTLQCTYDSSLVGNTTFAGDSENEEQCTAYLFVNRPIAAAWCSSEYSTESQLNRFGVEGISWDKSGHVRMVKSASSKSLVDQPLSKVTDSLFHWTPTVRTSLQRDLQFGHQTASCPSHDNLRHSLPPKFVNPMNNGGGGIRSRMAPVTTESSVETGSKVKGIVTLPKISQEYKPSSECQMGRNAVHRNNILRGNYNYKPLATSSSSTTISIATTPAPTPSSSSSSTAREISTRPSLFKTRGRVRLGFGRFSRVNNSTSRHTG